MARTAGIEITEECIRIAVLENGGRSVKVTAFTEEAIRPEEEEAWKEAAGRALREALSRARAPRIVASVDSGSALLRELSIPFKQPDQIRAVVPTELESQVHNHAIEDLLIDFLPTGETEKSTQVLAAALPKDLLKERLDLLQEAGADPVRIDLDVMALLNTLQAGEPLPKEEPFLILHGTDRFAKLVLVEEGKPRSIRTIRFSFPANPSDPEKAPPPDEDPDARTTLLAKEISRFLLANTEIAGPSHVVLTGTFANGETAARIEAATRIAPRIHTLPESIERESGHDAVLPVPLGLALAATGRTPFGLDFRKGEFVYRKRFETVKTTALVTLELVIVLLAALSLHYHLAARELHDGDLAMLQKKQGALYTHAFGEAPPEDPDATVDQFNDRMVTLQQEMGETSDFPLRHTALDCVARIFGTLDQLRTRHNRSKLGDAPLWLDIRRVQISQNTSPGRESLDLTITGAAQNHLYAEAFRSELKKIELFREAKFTRIGNTDEGQVTFNLTASFREEEE